MISLKFKSIRPYGIHQSSWNSLFKNSDTPYYFYYEKEEDLKKSIERYFDTNSKDCEWNFHDIGWHHFEEGFFSNTHYISCSNCSGGKITGDVKATIAKIKIIKENGDPSSPKDSFFSKNILDEKFVLWELKIDVKCEKCEKVSSWDSIQTTHDDGDTRHWNFNHYSDYFSVIK